MTDTYTRDELRPCEGMTFSDKLLDFVMGWEGCRLRCYQDIGGQWTVGYGTTGPWVDALAESPSPEITQAEADGMLFHRLDELAEQVADLLRVPLSQYQFDALVTFAYNVGLGAFKGSTLLKCVNACRFDAAALQFTAWTKAGGKHIEGLERRRIAEQAIFRYGEYGLRP